MALGTTGESLGKANARLGFKHDGAHAHALGTVIIDENGAQAGISTNPIAVDIVDNTGLADTPESFEDTSFVTGDSPATLDFNTALGRNATKGYIVNDGLGNFTISLSTDGAVFGDEITIKRNETFEFDNLSVDSLRVTWVADSGYRVAVI